jgi:hypothetical protein
MGIIIFILALPLLVGTLSVLLPLILCVVTLPLQLLGVMAEEEKAAVEAKE